MSNKPYERDVPSMSKVKNLKGGKRNTTRSKIIPFAFSYQEEIFR